MTGETANVFCFEPPSADNASLEDMAFWLVQVMDKRDRSVGEVCEILARLIKEGNATDRQAGYLFRTFQKVLKQYRENRLDIQGAVIAEDDGSPSNIRHFNAAKIWGEISQ